MKRNFLMRFGLLLLVVGVSLVALVPTFVKLADDTSYPFKKKINMGLDLQGGLYMVLGIDFDKVYTDEIKNYAQQITNYLNENNIETTMGELVDGDKKDPKHSVVINSQADVEKARDKIKDFFGSVIRLTDDSDNTLTYGLNRNFVNDIEKTAVSKSIEVVRNRIDEFGVTEPEIVSLGSDRIVVQLPGVDDIERAKELIGKTAKLEFRLVDEEVDDATVNSWYQKALKAGISYQKGDRFSEFVKKINEFLAKEIPKSSEIVFRKVVNKVNNEIKDLFPVLVLKNVPLTGEDLQDARANIDQQQNRPVVNFELKSRGAKVFEKLSGENVGKRMAIILDSNVYSDPVFNERIGGGRGQISLGQGDYNDMLSQARDLALVLRAGALPVDLQFEEQRIVGPSLGADAIKKAEFASMIGAALVFLFILIYYKMAGVFAVISLIFNVIIVLACLVGLEATLTLPGIAGIALTIGMAVDANIIIYERIKEELAEGAHFLQAVDAGFARAFWTILDANLTTAVAGFCLINFGTGPIRGFAVTLLIGIFATIYTAYFVSKLLFEYSVDKKKGQPISI